MMKVLFCEDDLLLLEDLTTLTDYDAAGYQVITAVNGAQGLRRFREERPQLVVTDVKMPIMDGLEMMQTIRQEEPRTQFILLSAFEDYAFLREAMQLGAKDYIRKTSVTGELLLEKLDMLKQAWIRENEYRAWMENNEGAASSVSADGYSPLLQKAVDYIRQELASPELSNSGVSEYVGMSEKRLGIRFRQETGMTMNEFITNMRVSRAKQLLRSGMMIYEAAEMTGFSSPQYFSSVFKSVTGMTPNDWKSRFQS